MGWRRIVTVGEVSAESLFVSKWKDSGGRGVKVAEMGGRGRVGGRRMEGGGGKEDTFRRHRSSVVGSGAFEGGGRVLGEGGEDYGCGEGEVERWCVRWGVGDGGGCGRGRGGGGGGGHWGIWEAQAEAEEIWSGWVRFRAGLGFTCLLAVGGWA